MKTKPLQLLLLFLLFIAIYSCEEDDSVIKQQNNFKTVALSKAKDFLKQSQEQSKSNPEESFITSISEKIKYETITNTDEQLAVIPVTTVYKNLHSRIVLLEIEGELQSAILSLNTFESSRPGNFSGEMLITDLKGNFIKGLRIENNTVVSHYIKSDIKTDKKNLSFNTSNAKSDCDNGCPFSVCDYCTLDEVVLTVPRQPNNTYISIEVMFPERDLGLNLGNYDYNYGGGGSGPTNPDPEPETPCPGDPLENMKILGTPKNGIPGGQYGYGRGRLHDGTDFAAPFGTAVYAAQPGVVANAPFRDNWSPRLRGVPGESAGNRIYINTNNYNGGNLQLGYWHLGQVLVGPGETVNKGQLLGYTGETGNVGDIGSGGPHLHMRARFNGNKADPEDFLSAEFDEDGNNINNCN